MHWGKFTDAIESLRRATPAASDAAEFITTARLLEVAQKFYLPDAANILGGKPVDESMKDLIRLPYEVIAVLSDTFIIETGAPAWTISVAVDLNGPTNQHMRVASPPSRRGFALFTADGRGEVAFLGAAAHGIADPLVLAVRPAHEGARR